MKPWTLRFWKRILGPLWLWPLSLAEKCRLAFGLAVAFSLALALLLPYIWMGQLLKKDLLDANRTKAQTLLYRTHFQPSQINQSALPPLGPTGSALDPNQPELLWLRFDKDLENKLAQLAPRQSRTIRQLKDDPSRDEQLELTRGPAGLESTYVRLFRASDSCLSCHNPQGSAGAFTLNQPVGAVVIHSTTIANEISKMALLNRIWIIVAGLIGGSGAIVAFYWITQRVILRPIRQLRALANNVAEGNLQVRSSIATGDEYEKLAKAFNHMLDALEAAQEKLRQANKQLDAKIAELSQRNIELYKANKVKSEFLANMSHEFRTPLNAILGFAQVLRDKPRLLRTDKGRRYAENILTSGNRLLTMINDLLELAKAQAGKLELHLEKASVAQLCESVVSSFSLQTKKKKIKVKLDLDDDLPLLYTDAGKVQQILYNFFDNAVKFTPERGRIRLSARMLDENTIHLAVSDTGCGIAKQDQEKIFEKFSQIDGSLTKERPGSGLGLAICKELADMLAASIGLESEPGKGSTFWLDIPIRLAVEPTEQAQPAQAGPQAATAAAKTDDDGKTNHI